LKSFELSSLFSSTRNRPPVAKIFHLPGPSATVTAPPAASAGPSHKLKPTIHPLTLLYIWPLRSLQLSFPKSITFHKAATKQGSPLPKDPLTIPKRSNPLLRHPQPQPGPPVLDPPGLPCVRPACSILQILVGVPTICCIVSAAHCSGLRESGNQTGEF
jgi:hypothetical protein